jgi:hypothetical protein
MAVALFTAPQDEQRRTRLQRVFDGFAVAMLVACGVDLVVLAVLHLFGLG